MVPNRGNGLGLVLFVLSGAIAGVGGLLLKLPNAFVMITVGAAPILMDGLLRWRARPAPGWLTQSKYGGFFFFVPVWVMGIFVIVVNVVSALAAKPGG